MPWTDDGRKRAVAARVQVRAAKQREHDEQLRPWLEQAARLRLRGNALVDWLDANDVPPPRGGRWTRMSVQRIRQRLGLSR